MKLTENHDVSHFVLFLENVDGNSYNQLMRDLCAIYADSLTGSIVYLPSAVARTSVFVSKYYPLFWAKYSNNKNLFHMQRTEITSFVSTELASSALKEFQIGNVYEKDMAPTLNPILLALTQTLLFTETDDNGRSLDKSYSPSDFASESLEKLYKEYETFFSEVEGKITEEVGDSWSCIDDFYNIAQFTENQTEHDYILTRNHHGAGFWDGDWDPLVAGILTVCAQKQSEIHAYVGDDGRIYLI